MPATTTTILSWGATLSAAASAAYVNRRNSQDDILTVHAEKESVAMTPNLVSSPNHGNHYSPERQTSRNHELHILTFVLGKD